MEARARSRWGAPPYPRRVIVAVKWGPLHGKKAAVSPGETLRVGRGGLADLVVAADGQMSPLHVEVSWDGERCRFRDLDSARGTQHNGEGGTAEGEIRNGDWLKAGETLLTVHVEDATPARPPSFDPDQDEEAQAIREAARAANAEQALAAIQEAADGPLYAVLDAARSPRILELCREAVEEHRSLYEGIEGETMAHVAPYLVPLPPDSRLFAALVREGWGKRWGIYFTSEEPLKAVRRHLRRYLMVERQDTHERLYFRFYDPAVLAVFLRTARVLQRTELFSQIDAFLFEGEGGAVTIVRGRDEAADRLAGEPAVAAEGG